VRLWIAPREFDSLRSPHLLGGRPAVGRGLLRQFESAPPIQPGRLAVGRNFLKVDIGGSNPSLAANFTRGRRSTDQDTRLRTGRLGGSNPPARTISARRPRDRAQPSEG
jgi:hypothetical protein